jgi:hypothetical protein
MPAPPWHPDVRAAVRRALDEAGAIGVAHAGARFLVAAVLEDRGGRVQKLVSDCGLDPSELRERLSSDPVGADEPVAELVGSLKAFRVLPAPPPTGRKVAHAVLRAMFTMVRLTRVDYLLLALEMEAIRQAVRMGSAQVTTAHLLLTVLELDRNLEALGEQLPGALATANCGGRVLADHGIGYDAAIAAATEISDPVEPAAAPVAGPWWWKPSRQRWWRTKYLNPPWAASAAEAADRTGTDTRRRRTRPGTGPLLAAVLAEPDGPACQVLHQLGADPATVSVETTRQLGWS